MTQLSAIEHAEQMSVIDRVRPTYGYYRQPNGWITCSPVTELEELHYRREGWEPLPQYGLVEMTGTYMADHPLEVLFMYGGAHELLPEQVIEQGLWMTPPLVPACHRPINQSHKRHSPGCWSRAKPVDFPQIAPDTIRYYECHFCQARKPTERARDQHESVMHKDEQGDLRTGQALADALLRGFGGSTRIAESGDQQPSQAATSIPATALQVLAGVGLSRKQMEALRAAGIAIPEVEDSPGREVRDAETG